MDNWVLSKTGQPTMVGLVLSQLLVSAIHQWRTKHSMYNNEEMAGQVNW